MIYLCSVLVGLQPPGKHVVFLTQAVASYHAVCPERRVRGYTNEAAFLVITAEDASYGGTVPLWGAVFGVATFSVIE